MKTFNLPDLGEGLPEAEITAWYISEGDEIKLGEPLLSVETAKAIVDIPSPHSGTIVKLFGNKNDVIHTGDPLVEFSFAEAEAEVKQASESATVVGEIVSSGQKIVEQPIAINQNLEAVRATPAVRALARHLDVDLSVVTPSGKDGLITSDDVKRVNKTLQEVGDMEPLRGVRRAMARNMAAAHAEVVPATLMDDAEITSWPSGVDTSVRLIRALVAACQAEPSLNSWYDSHAMGKRRLKQVDVGIAVDSSAGLFVAVLREAQKKGVVEIRESLDELKKKIDSRSIKPEEMRAYTIMLSNFGNIAGRYASPVVLPPTVAILAAGKIRESVLVKQGEIQQAKLLPLSLTFDHRAVTGGEAARFLAVVLADLKLAD